MGFQTNACLSGHVTPPCATTSTVSPFDETTRWSLDSVKGEHCLTRGWSLDKTMV